MSQIDESAVRAQLIDQRDRLRHDIYELTRGERSAQPSDPVSDRGGLKSEPADDADMAFEAERAQAVAGNSQILLSQVEAALLRLDSGTYGKCAQCGKDISPKRLERLPWATLCIDCQSKNEARHTR